MCVCVCNLTLIELCRQKVRQTGGREGGPVATRDDTVQYKVKKQHISKAIRNIMFEEVRTVTLVKGEGTDRPVTSYLRSES